MKKFENILLISDIDGTLIDDEWEISKENIDAVHYFTENGGTFTYATGRQVPVAKILIEQLAPNAPVICYNGAAIYDFHSESYVWSAPLDPSVMAVVQDVHKNCPNINIEVNAADGIYVIKDSLASFSRYERLVPFFKITDSVKNIAQPWFKIVFVMEDDYMPTVRSHIESSPYYKDYQFSQSAPFLYELLSFNINKGSALPYLKKLLGNKHKVIAVGDNENDIEFVKSADVGFAVANSSPLLLKHCQNLTVHQNEHVLADIINKLI